MNKVLIFSDIHIHPHKRRNERLEDCLSVLQWVFDQAKSNGVKSILFGGDLFHDRQKIDVYTYQRTFEVLKKNLSTNDFELYVLLGNHDMWFNEDTSISSVTPLGSLPNMYIIDKPTRMTIAGASWDFIPFTHDPILAMNNLSKQAGNMEYCLGHLAIDGAVLHGSSISDVAIEHDGEMVKVSTNLFKDYKKVFLGHYHSEQILKPNVEYVGSPLQLSFGEAFQEKHIVLLDCVSGDQSYIKNDFSPIHLVLRPDEVSSHDLDKNFVRVVVDDISATDLLDMRKDIAKDKTLGSLEIRQQKRKVDDKVIEEAKNIILREDDMIQQYVDAVGYDGLDREKLIKVGKMICEGGID
jgi:DNA repair exonuclease SbcCD nuclease subunit